MVPSQHRISYVNIREIFPVISNAWMMNSVAPVARNFVYFHGRNWSNVTPASVVRYFVYYGLDHHCCTGCFGHHNHSIWNSKGIIDIVITRIECIGLIIETPYGSAFILVSLSSSSPIFVICGVNKRGNFVSFKHHRNRQYIEFTPVFLCDQIWTGTLLEWKPGVYVQLAI